MRQKVFIFVGLVFLVALLVGLNAASYVRKETSPDDEMNPNRSTFNAGATGTRALFELLAETGGKPVRWQEPPAALSSASGDKNNPSTFVVVGKTRRQFSDEDIEQLLRWVSNGGKLVVIDRNPPENLIATTASWKISVAEAKFLPVDVDPSDNLGFDPSNQPQMTAKTAAAKPVQPTIFTANINAVQPSRLASGVSFERFSSEETPAEDTNNKVISTDSTPATENAASDDEIDEAIESSALSAPFVHLANDKKNLLVDFPFGSGQIVILSDPYIVSNGGINLVDNAQIAVNVVASRGGVIAFDEYHQGFGANDNRFFDYLAGTPVFAILMQIAILTGLIFFAQSRRFARALPEAEPNRLSKLEYVSAMAQLQHRTKAFDLAIENIYTDFRCRAARFLGADNYAVSSGELAKLISERIDGNEIEIESLMRKCEEIIRGEPTNKKEVIEITSSLRRTEEKLGLKRRK